jgi:hypothetical protein
MAEGSSPLAVGETGIRASMPDIELTGSSVMDAASSPDPPQATSGIESMKAMSRRDMGPPEEPSD